MVFDRIALFRHFAGNMVHEGGFSHSWTAFEDVHALCFTPCYVFKEGVEAVARVATRKKYVTFTPVAVICLNHSHVITSLPVY